MLNKLKEWNMKMICVMCEENMLLTLMTTNTRPAVAGVALVSVFGMSESEVEVPWLHAPLRVPVARDPHYRLFYYFYSYSLIPYFRFFYYNNNILLFLLL